MNECSQSEFRHYVIKRPDLMVFIDEYGKNADRHIHLKIEQTKQSLNEVFEIIKSTKDEIRANNLSTSFLFNFFDLFRVNENKMSEILAFLLNPKGTHGQNDTYFKEFCTYFDLPEIDISQSFYIRCEEYTDINRRIDLLIKAGDYFIIIENKFRGAKDQKHQLEHYYEFIRRKVSTAKHVYLFYIKDGSDPSDYTLPNSGEAWKELNASNNLKTIAFKQSTGNELNIVTYLENCKLITTSEKMKFFIEDILQHISKENRMKKYDENMFNWLSESPERTEYAYEIVSLWGAYKKTVIQNFLKEFIDTLNQALGKKFNGLHASKYSDIFTERYSGYRIFIHDDYHVYFQSDNIGFDNIHYGLAPLHQIDTSETKRNFDFNLRERLLREYPVQGGVTDASIVKYKSKISDIGDISDFIKLLPANKQETMSIWIDEIASLVDFLLVNKYFE